MAPHTQTQNSKNSSISISDHSSLQIKDDNNNKNECDNNIPLDKNYTLRLGTFGSFALGGFFLAFYAYGLYFLYNEYNTIYFKKLTDPSTVDNHLRRWAPLYVIAIFMEGIYAYLKGYPLYRTGDSFCSGATFVCRGVCQRMLAMSLLCYGVYGYVWDHIGVHLHKLVFPVFLQESSLFQFIAIIICDEFAYYWVHRLGHTMRIFWNIHQVHHNGEVFNLGTSVRNSAIVRFSTTIFYLPLALFFDPPVFIIFRQFNLLYQFWIHTEFIGKLGWLEYVLNTPSQHRVHHGRNEYCIDKNFGGMTCIFDRLFGSFQEEIDEIPPVYGLTAPIDSLDPWKLNWYPWYATFSDMYHVKGLKNKFLVLWNGPGWIPGSNPPKEYPIPPITRNTFQIRNPKFSRGALALLIFEICLAIVIFNIADKNLGFDIQNMYLTTVVAFTGLCVYTISSTVDRFSNSSSIQLVTITIGICLFSYGSIHRYHPDILMKTIAEIAVYVFVGLFLILAVLNYKSELNAPLTDKEYARDLEGSEKAYEAQLNYAKEAKKQKGE